MPGNERRETMMPARVLSEEGKKTEAPKTPCHEKSMQLKSSEDQLKNAELLYPSQNLLPAAHMLAAAEVAHSLSSYGGVGHV
jgi:hypothetical protein